MVANARPALSLDYARKKTLSSLELMVEWSREEPMRCPIGEGQKKRLRGRWGRGEDRELGSLALCTERDVI